ncbi:ABC transporter permease [Hymenobacter terricola]|uniref:ABC transporter permease n=1 Tax=Hymenobacter terricola TaxID=2819236 RepID=UPI001B311272|nr:ABC transporter permease [Hymenobacter terricola]
MLLSYLKIAWKVLMRRKFFTFINLFGVSFTLMILLVVMAMFDQLTGNHAPEKRNDRMLFISRITEKMRGEDGWMMNPVSSYFTDTYVRPMHTPALVGLTSIVSNATAFTSNKLLPLDVRYTDGNFWQIMEFDFRSGRGLTGAEVKQAAPVCVLNEATALTYFGTTTDVVGREIEIDLKRYRVAGVVANVAAAHLFSYADVWLPCTLSKDYGGAGRLEGSFIPILLAPSAGQVQAVRDEYQQVMARVPISDPKHITNLYSNADPIMASISRELMPMKHGLDGDGLAQFYLICTALALLFMLLPALNLVNLNVTRILERSAEIGVRKAFGATGTHLVSQFLVENVVLAVVGGLLGLGLAAGALALVNESHVLAYANFALSGSVFGWALVLALAFGLMSGVYPAWKMSRLNPVAALRGSGEQK